MPEAVNDTAVLYSGGLDSAVLVASEARAATVHPLYVAAGLSWEAEERRRAEALLHQLAPAGRLRPMVTLELTVRDVYPATHWALNGTPPGYDTPDEDVYLTGRNLLLIGKAAIYCARQRISRLALGPLAGNPFPDARPEFFAAISTAASLALDHSIQAVTPFAELHKEEVIRLGLDLGVPLELTLSCMNPRGGVHCGACSKCRERQQAFAAAGVADLTPYRARQE
jgi:7-cyano-7-deazaguanine synthase